MNKPGQLYVIATPIGNLGDITFRAISVLKELSLLGAEDTRQSKKLLAHYNIHTPLISLHAHNEKERSRLVIEKIKDGENVGYITDAGTPSISDPGFYLINAVRKAGFKVVPIPGACAAITALSVSGLSADHFSFEGFLPSKIGERRKRLEELSNMSDTLIFYESPHRIVATIKDMVKVFGSMRYGVIARELTKKFETIHGDRLESLLDWLQQNKEQQKGEFVLLIKGSEAKQSIEEDYLEKVLSELMVEMPIKKAVSIAERITGEAKNRLYQIALTLKKLV